MLDFWGRSGPNIGWAQGNFNGYDSNGNGTVDFLDFQKLLDYWNPGGWDFCNLSLDAGIGMGLSATLTPSNNSGGNGNILVSSTEVGQSGDTFSYAWSVIKDGLAYDPPGLVTDQQNLQMIAVGGTYTATLTVTDNQTSGALTTSDTFTVSPTLDPSFGTGGIVVWKTGGAGVIDVAKATAVQQIDGDTKTVVVGYGTGTNYQVAVIARFNSDGSIDTTFGDRVDPNDPNNLARTGWTTIDLGGASAANAVSIDASGRIFVGGYTTTSAGKDFLVACYTSDGVLDTSFGSGGEMVTDFNGYDDVVNSLAIQAANSTTQTPEEVIAGGYATWTDGYSTSMAVAEYTYSNQTTPVFETAVTYGSDEACSVGLQSDGKIVLGGPDGGDGILLERFTTSGGLDTTFGDPNYYPGVSDVSFGMATSGTPFSMVIEGNDKILVAGTYWSLSGGNQFMVARFDPDGSLDDTFGAVSGSVRTGMQFVGAQDSGMCMAMEVDGSILVAGALSHHGFAFDQFSSQGDLTSQYSDPTLHSFVYPYDKGYSVAVEPDGSIFIAGSNGSYFVLARFVFQLTV